jgi:hypothetical protein
VVEVPSVIWSVGIFKSTLPPEANSFTVVKDTVKLEAVLRVATFLVIVAVIGVGRIGVTLEFDFISLFMTAPDESVVEDTKFPESTSI